MKVPQVELKLPFSASHNSKEEEETLHISNLVCGNWRWTPETDGYAILKACLEAGITTIDTSDIYGDYTCEALLGSVLQQHPDLRSQIQIITKCGIKLVSKNRPENEMHYYDVTKEHIFNSVERSLQNLKTSYIDLYLIHRPDPLMIADEVLEAMHQLKKDGKVRHFGVSNFTTHQFELMHSRYERDPEQTCTVPLVTNEIEFSALHMDPLFDGTLDQCQRLGIRPLSWSSLGGGALMTSEDPKPSRVRHTMEQIAKNHQDCGIDQIALAWILKHPSGVIPIIGSTKPERISSAAKAVGVQLTRTEWFSIWEASAGKEVP